MAIIVPVEKALQNIASQSGVKGNGLEDLCQDEKLQGAVLKELQSVGKQGGLAGQEIIDGVVLADEEWTPQNVSFVSLASHGL